MSWAEDVIAALERWSPNAVRLAETVSPAIRIEPELLRGARLAILPETDAGCEADLWFSDLVENRSPAGIILQAEAAAVLRRRLALDCERLTRAAAVIAGMHRDVAPALRLEEELTVLYLRGDADGLRERLRSAVASLVDPNRPGLATWAARALEHLPDPLHDLEEVQMLAAGARLRVGEDAAPTIDVPHERLVEWMNWLAPQDAGRLSIGIALVEGGIEIGAIRGTNVHAIEVPDLHPILIEVSWREGGALRRETVRVRAVGVRFVEGPMGEIELRTARGDRFHLRKKTSVVRDSQLRVQIEYDIELYGSQKTVQLPFVIGVMADLSGIPAEPLPAVADRKFLEIDADNFEDSVIRATPRMAVLVPNTLTGSGELSIDITFKSMDDFSPAGVVRKIDALNPLLEDRRQLDGLLSYMDGNAGAEELIAQTINDPTLLHGLATAQRREATAEPAQGSSEMQAESQVAGVTTDEFSQSLQREFRPLSDGAREAVAVAVQTLAKQVLANTAAVSPDVVGTIKALIDVIDRRLTAQLNVVLHHPDFQALESTWRGLLYFVNNTETSDLLKIRILNIKKNELQDNLAQFMGETWDQSPLFRKIYEEEYGTLGGQPYGCLVGDYHFDHSPGDVSLLNEIAKISAAAHAPFITGASPSAMQMDSWQELAHPLDLTRIFTTPEYAGWRSLRESEDARYIGLTMPRFLARLPYGAKTNPVDEFDFEEDVQATMESNDNDNDKFCWANSAYAMATNIARAFNRYGWCARIGGVESGGAIEGLPVFTFKTDDGGVDIKCPTEIGITDRRQAELAKNGFMPLVHKKSSDFAAFIGVQSLQKPDEYEDPDATANANLAARLSYLFPVCRFTHYAKCIVRDKIGSFRSRDDMERFLKKWIMEYVDGDPVHSSEETKARMPLAAAEVVVEEVDGNPGYYILKLYLRPHFQLEGLTVALRMVSRVPAVRG